MAMKKIIAGFVRDENENNKYICVSDELNIDCINQVNSH